MKKNISLLIMLFIFSSLLAQVTFQTKRKVPGNVKIILKVLPKSKIIVKWNNNDSTIVNGTGTLQILNYNYTMGLNNITFKGDLDSLIYLDMSGDSIISIPENINEFRALENLVLNDNPIKRLPKKVSRLKYLKRLEMQKTEVLQDSIVKKTRYNRDLIIRKGKRKKK